MPWDIYRQRELDDRIFELAIEGVNFICGIFEFIIKVFIFIPLAIFIGLVLWIRDKIIY